MHDFFGMSSSESHDKTSNHAQLNYVSRQLKKRNGRKTAFYVILSEIVIRYT